MNSETYAMNDLKDRKLAVALAARRVVEALSENRNDFHLLTGLRPPQCIWYT